MEEKRQATIYDYARMCNSVPDCAECPLVDKSIDNDCGWYIAACTDEVNEIILKWCDEHPVKTYKDDFLEKFPKATINAHGVPDSCVSRIYGTICPLSSGGVVYCSECWNSAMEETK